MKHLQIMNELTKNTNFRQVLITGEHSQVVVMSVEPGDDIGDEVHTVDQVLIFSGSAGKAIVDGEERPITENELFFVPAGTQHNFINTGSTPMKVLSIYAPAEHPDGTIHVTKADAVAAEEAEATKHV
ncbi:MAG: cupin domain-containing protein [bacterium]|nr:cupin domain-containing protein [bacterium]